MKIKAKEQGIIKCKRIFGRILRFLFRQRRPKFPSPVPHLSLFLIRSDIFFSSFPQDLSDYISLCQLLGWQVRVSKLPSQTECEGIGYCLHFEGRQLKWQEHLQLQVVRVEKKRVFSQRLDLSTQIVDEHFLNSLFGRTYVNN